jgi:hypothetical protein
MTTSVGSCTCTTAVDIEHLPANYMRLFQRVLPQQLSKLPCTTSSDLSGKVFDFFETKSS